MPKFKLKRDNKLFSSIPIRQAKVLDTISNRIIWVLCGAHVFVLCAIVFTLCLFMMPSQLDIRDPLSKGASIVSFLFGSAIILIAITSATVRALQQGLQPEREVERYQQYRSALQAMRRQFEAAPNASEKIKVMQRMEHIAFDEMRNFLITIQRSSFAM